MATYQQIQDWVRDQYGWTPKTCWIADCKELAGLDRHDAPNRHGRDRIEPCPKAKREAIFRAFRHFTMLLVLTVTSVLAVGEQLQAQQAAASLERVEAGDVDAPAECGTELCRESRRVCLNTGAFVLAFKANTDIRMASAALTTEQAESEDVEDQGSGETPGWKFFGWYPGAALVSEVLAHPDHGWGWEALVVDEPQCYFVTARAGRARLYELRVGVSWGELR